MPHPYDHNNKIHPSKRLSNLKNFLVSFLKLLNDQTSVQVLQSLLEKCNLEEEIKLEQKTVNHVHRKKRTNREFILNENIGDFNMGDILDLGCEVNVLPKKTWECTGEPTLGYSLVQLKLLNQHTVIQIGQLKGIPIDLYGVCTMEYFEVIDIVDNTTPYLALLGLDWEFDNKTIINLNTRKIIFQLGEYRVIEPLDPSEGGGYVEQTTENFITEEINQFYRTTMSEEDYINLIAYGMLIWRIISSCALDFDTGLDNWKQCLSTRRCVRIMYALRWVGT
jgi:hypothetical protein